MLSTLLTAGVLLVSTSAAAAAPGWPSGLPKVPAAKAPPLASGVSGYAVVRAIDGTVRNGSNVVGAEHVAPGAFVVQFNSNVSACALNATIGDPIARPAGPPPMGLVSVVSLASQGGKAYVYVETADPGGAPADLNFHLTVTC